MNHTDTPTQWETVIASKGRPARNHPTIRLSRYRDGQSVLTLNDASVQVLGRPTHIVTEMDPTRTWLAVRAARTGDPEFNTINATHHQASVRGVMTELGITEPCTFLMIAEMQGERLVARIPDQYRKAS